VHRFAISNLDVLTAHISCLGIIAFSCLDRNMPEQKLNLVQFPASCVAEPGALRRKSCGASARMPAAVAYSRTMCHTTFSVMPVPQAPPALSTRRNTLPLVTFAASVLIQHRLYPVWNRTVRVWPALPCRSITPKGPPSAECGASPTTQPRGDASRTLTAPPAVLCHACPSGCPQRVFARGCWPAPP
jgi:hypothetical protein